MVQERLRATRPTGAKSIWLASVFTVPLGALPFADFLARSIVPMIQAAMMVLLAVFGLILLAFLLFKRWIAAGVVAVGLLFSTAVMALPPTVSAGATMLLAAEQAQAPDITVLTLNVEYSRADIEQTIEQISASGADLVVLVEVNENFVKALLKRGVAEQLPHRTGEVISYGSAGTAILSRWAVDFEFDFADVIPGERIADHPVVVVHHPSGPVRVVGVHPWPPVGDSVDSWYQTLTELTTWHEQATDLPLIIAGDFNASNGHPVYRRLAADLTDTAVVAGPLPQSTWPVHAWIPPFTALDHVLVRDLKPVSWHTFEVEGTDHLGIVTGVIF